MTETPLQPSSPDPGPAGEMPAASPDSPPWHSLTPEQVTARLRVTSGRGLSASEAAARRAQYGASELLVRGGRTLWSMIGEQFGDVVIRALLAATIVSALSGGYLDAAVIVTIVLLNAGMGLVQERKAEQSLAALQRIAAPHAHMLRAGAAE